MAKQKKIETSGRLHGLARRIGKIGGEHITFVITLHDLDRWDDLVAAAEQDVDVVLVVKQGALDLGKKEAAEERDPRQAEIPGTGRPKKAPTGKHAVAED